MAYCTLTDIQERIPEETLIQLTDDAQNDAVDQEQVSAAIERADAEIDAWCGRRYVVPFAPVPAIARELSADLAAGLLHGRRGVDVPEAVQVQAKAARDLLKAISKGEVQIGAPVAGNSTGPARIEISGPERIFTRETLKGM